MVSNASDDLPEPDRPVKTTSLSRGMATSMFFRLCSRAPRMVIWRASRAIFSFRSGIAFGTSSATWFDLVFTHSGKDTPPARQNAGPFEPLSADLVRRLTLCQPGDQSGPGITVENRCKKD